MISPRSRIVVLIHVILIVILSALLAFVLMERKMFFVPLTISLALIAVMANLFRYLDRTAGELTRFLLSIREGAFMDEQGRRAAHPLSAQFSAALNDVTREFARVSLEKELQYQYLKTLNENIGAGIISVDADGTIRMINAAAKQIIGATQLLKLPDLHRIDPGLYDLMSSMDPEQSELYRINTGGEEAQLSVKMKEMVLRNATVKIFLLQNINSEIDQNEIEAWQQLTRVLTHEIMNSVTPITALSKASQKILRRDGEPKKLVDLTDENLLDINDSVNTIASRSENLLKFVSSYRAFNKPLVINRSEADVVSLIDRAINLLKPEAGQKAISIQFNHPPAPVMSNVDTALMEQVMINLLKNAIESIPPAQTGMISIDLSVSERKIRISVSDNGKGMDADTASKIFVPFFTTKPGGSGIGLSLARQIVLAHRGTIRMKTRPDAGSTFLLEWKAD